MSSDRAIQIESLVKHFPMGGSVVEALKGVNLALGEGEFAGLVGPLQSNGSREILIANAGND